MRLHVIMVWVINNPYTRFLWVCHHQHKNLRNEVHFCTLYFFNEINSGGLFTSVEQHIKTIKGVSYNKRKMRWILKFTGMLLNSSGDTIAWQRLSLVGFAIMWLLVAKGCLKCFLFRDISLIVYVGIPNKTCWIFLYQTHPVVVNYLDIPWRDSYLKAPEKSL